MKKVWISPCPGVGFPAMEIGAWGPLRRFLYRDLDGKCRRTLMLWPSDDLVFERS